MNKRTITAFLLIICLGFAVFTLKNKILDNDEPFTSEEDSYFEVVEDEGLRSTVLYYKNDNGLIVPVMRKIPWPEDKAIAKAALSNMIDDVNVREDIAQIGLLPVIPAGTRINGIAIKEDGLCRVDFSSEILNQETAMDEEAMIKGIVYALTEFPTISKVQIMVDGKVLSSMNFGTDISKPIAREDINLIEEASVGQSKVVVYYKGTTNGIDEYYVPVTIPIDAPNANVLSALEKLFEGADPSLGLYSDIPLTAELLGVEIDDGVAYINLNEEVKASLNDQSTYEAMAKNIALTLEQFEDINDIVILLNGETLEEAGLDYETEDVMPTFANEY